MKPVVIKKTKTELLLESPKYQQYIDDLVRLIREGWRNNELYAEILSQEFELSQSVFYRMLGKAYDKIKMTLHKDREYLFELHMNRYEDIYKNSLILKDRFQRDIDPIKNVAVIAAKLTNAMKALKAKEDLVGLHNKDVIIEVNNKQTVAIQAHGNLYGYFVSKLDLEEKKELLQLLDKCRVGQLDGVRPLVIKKSTFDIETGEKTEEVKVIDTSYEEMPESVIHKMKNEEDEKPEDLFFGPIVEDTVDRSKSGKSLEEVQHGIHEDIKTKFERLMKRTKQK